MAIGQREAADRELIARAGQGDRDAFGALYERHFQGLYDFALRMLRDGDLAADVVQSTFVRAWDAMQKQRGVDNVKAWLYTIAHNLAIDELRLRKRFVEPREEDDFPFAIVDPSRFSDPENVRRDRELVELVWESAAALSPQEYALLDLHLRRGFDADELAEHLGLAKGAVYTRLSRLRDSLEEAVATTLLMRRGRRECAELDALMARLRATEASQPVRRAIREHLDDCERCQESKRRFVSPAEIFAGISLVPVPSELIEEIWERIASEIGLAAAVGGGVVGAETASPGDPGASASSAPTAKGVAVSALATGAVIVIATALVFRADGDVDDPGDVRSTTHAVGQPSLENVVSMGWSRQGDADAYSISWDRDRALPDEIADLDGDATRATSPPLATGSWFFNLRTRGDGEWTRTVHVGPFVIRRDVQDRRSVRPRLRVGPTPPKQRVAPLEGSADEAPPPPISFTALSVVAGAQKTSGTPSDAPEEERDAAKPVPRRAPVLGPIILAPPPPQPPPLPPPPRPPSPVPPPPPETTTTTTTTTTTETTTTTTTTGGEEEIPEDPPEPPPPPPTTRP